MDAIGIDYQQMLTVLALREGRDASARVRGIGDGLRRVIPNAVRGEGQWGSRALLMASGDALLRGDGEHDEPWLALPGAAIFWRHLAERLYAYLGNVRPTSATGYQVVIALHALDQSAAVAKIESLCRAAGLTDVIWLPAIEALLCRWLVTVAQATLDGRTVAVVVVGDTATLIGAYHLCVMGSGGDRHLVASGQTPRRIAGGHATWTASVIAQVNAHLAEPVGSEYELALRDATLEYARRLRFAGPHQSLEWTGPLRERMFTPLWLSRADCHTWPEVARFGEQLSSAIQEVMQCAVGGSRPELIVLGGVGTTWPFAAEALGGMSRIWQSDAPEEDVAIGAAWRPALDLEIRYETFDAASDVGGASGVEAASTESETAEEITAPAEEAPLPPWQRVNWLDV